MSPSALAIRKTIYLYRGLIDYAHVPVIHIMWYVLNPGLEKIMIFFNIKKIRFFDLNRIFWFKSDFFDFLYKQGMQGDDR